MPRVDGDRLRELHAQGLSDPQIAAALGCSKTSVFNWRVRLGLRGYGAERAFSDADLIKLHAQGLPDDAIAPLLGVSRGSVQRWRKHLKIAPNKVPRPAYVGPKDDQIRAMHATGAHDSTISIATGLTVAQVRHARYRLGLLPNQIARKSVLSDDDLALMHGEGLTDDQIAARVGLSLITVQARRRALGLYLKAGRPASAAPPPAPSPAPKVKAALKVCKPTKPSPAAVKAPERSVAQAPQAIPSGLQAMIDMARRESAAMKRAGRI